jgi:hypothetical protein
MRRSTYGFSLLLALMVLSACQKNPSVLFEHPQPAGEKNLEGFKNKYTGNYNAFNKKGPTATITRNMIILHYGKNFSLPKEDVDTAKITLPPNKKIMVNDSLFVMDNDTFPFRIVGDSLVFSLFRRDDTLFTIDKDHILRYYKKTYFLNVRTPLGLWEVSTLRLRSNGILTAATIPVTKTLLYALNDITDVQGLTNTKGEVARYIIDPTKKELKKILRRNLFRDKTLYRKAGYKEYVGP